MPDTPPQPPRVLIASHHAEAGLALKELGEKSGYTVVRCFTAVQALERARATRPDVIVLDESLVDADPLETSRALRDDPLVGASTPILYTTRGLALRAQELTLQAFHHGAALACVALAPVLDDTGDGAAAVQLVARVLRSTGRRSDAIGRIGPSEFAVVAPGTDGAGAVMLAQRVVRAVRAACGTEPPALRAGYDAVGNTRYTPVEPKNLLARATSALRLAKGDAAANWIRAFDAA